MPGGALRIGTFRGIEVRLHVSWLLAVVFLTWSLASGWFPEIYPGWPEPTYYLVAGIAAILLFASVLLHAIHRAALPLETASGVLGCGYDSSCHTGSVEPGARAAAVSHGRPVWSTWIDARRGRGCVGIVVGENPDGAAWQIDEAPVNARDPLQTTVGARLMPDPPV